MKRFLFVLVVLVMMANLLPTVSLTALPAKAASTEAGLMSGEVGSYMFEDPVHGTQLYVNTANQVYRFTTLGGYDTGIVPAKRMFVKPNKRIVILDYAPRFLFRCCIDFSRKGCCGHLWDGYEHERYKIKAPTDGCEVDEDFTIPTTTIVLGQTTRDHLSSLSEDYALTFNGATRQLNELSPGDVIVSGVSPVTPYGLLRKVSDIIRDGDQMVVTTDAASLEEAIEDAVIDGSWILSPDGSATPNILTESTQNIVNAMQTEYDSAQGNTEETKWGMSTDEIITNTTTTTDVGMFESSAACQGFYVDIDNIVLYDDDGDLSTTGDQIKAKGSLCADIGFDLMMTIDNWTLTEAHFSTTVTETAQLEVSAECPLANVDEKVEVYKQSLNPITVMVGWLPVVILPVLTVNVGVDADISVGITTSVTQTSSATLGLDYANGDWSPLNEFSNAFGWDTPSLTADCEIKAYAGPQLDFLLYGLVGPYGEVRGYLELEADLLSTPWWELYGGLEAAVGFTMGVIGNDIADYKIPDLIRYRQLLAQADEASGEISGSVEDALTGTPLQGVICNAYDGEPSGDPLTTGTTDSNGLYSLSVPEGSGYSIDFSRTGYQTATYHNIVVEAEATTYLAAVLQIDDDHAGVGDVSGTIVNALDGTGVEGLAIHFREGINVISGPVVASTTTSIGGSYSFIDIQAGHYTAEVGGVGYITTYFTVVCIGGVITPNQNASITPILSPGETRIVLTWGATPSDLDSHLTGPLADGTRFHMFYPYAEANNGSPWPTQVQLDLDDVTSYGPETTTILAQIEGTYRFSVHDYTNRAASSSYALSNSGAQVIVYRGATIVSIFVVPPSQEGTLWTVFEMTEDTITPLNIMSYESGPGNVT